MNPEINDYSGLSGIPLEVFSPTSAEHLSEFLIQNPSKSFRIGAGRSGVSGGAVPLPHECYLDVSGLKQLHWYDEASGIVRCEAGVTLDRLLAFIQASAWDFPVIPGSKHEATVGGMVACHGGGPLSLKYGKIGNYILALDVVLANGEKIQCGGTATKISQGIQDNSIWIGSEGTLGIITSIMLKCIPKMPPLRYFRIAAQEFSALLELVPNLLQFDPYLLEIANQDALHFSSKAKEHVIWAAFLSNPPLVTNPLFTVHEATSDVLHERFSIGHNLQAYKPFVDLDVSFPVKVAAKAILALMQLLREKSLEHIVFGHGGDGNYHIHVFFDDNLQAWDQVQIEFDNIINLHHGFISGEHGIGRIHKHRLAQQISPWRKKIYLALKSCLDPNHQLPSFI